MGTETKIQCPILVRPLDEPFRVLGSTYYEQHRFKRKTPVEMKWAARPTIVKAFNVQNLNAKACCSKEICCFCRFGIISLRNV
jgi:hypothetical protein